MLDGAPPEVLAPLQARRAELTEMGSALQRWSVSLTLESARQAEAHRSLTTLEEQVGDSVVHTSVPSGLTQNAQ